MGTYLIQLGLVYQQGRVVAKDDSEAAKWYRLAAEQDCAEAQFILGVFYGVGEVVPEDLVQAYKWITLAKDNKHAGAAALLEGFAEDISQEQKAEALSLAAEWRKEYGRRQE